MSRLKILVFIFAVGVAGSIIAAAYWFYTRIIGADTKLETQIVQLQSKKNAPPDPGIKRFEKAAELIKEGNLEESRTALYELLRSFPNSMCAPEAKRIIGEMNLDMMFSVNTNPLKKNYIVQPGDSMGLIARKNQTTIECILRANGMMSNGLQPGDHLFVFPLEFDLVVDVSAKTVTLLRNQRFIKEYQALEINLPSGVKIPADLTLNDKAAWVNGKRVLSTDSQFMNADKWLMVNKPGFNIRAQTQAKPVNQAEVITPAAVAKTTKKNSKAKTSGNVTPNDTADPSDEVVVTTGVFLPREDAEELFTLIRTGTPLKVVR